MTFSSAPQLKTGHILPLLRKKVNERGKQSYNEFLFLHIKSDMASISKKVSKENMVFLDNGM
jgi:hypothetical protein